MPDASKKDISLLRSSPEIHQLNVHWLIRLRWVAIIGQTMVILAAWWILTSKFPYEILFGLVAAEMVSNIALAVWSRKRQIGHESLIGFVLVVDVLFLTSLLYWSGGSFNPFSLLLFIHIALAALVLRTFWTWLVALLSVVCYGGLFFEYRHPQLEWSHRTGFWNIETQGQWVAFAVTAGVLAFFINKIQRALLLREAELVRVREEQMRDEKLASLATLAAGAAHEFSTPLATIALVASELQRNLEKQGADDALLEDARLIREQVRRCRAILQQMSADAGESPGELARPITVSEFMDLLLDGVQQTGTLQRFIMMPPDTIVTVPPTALAQALRGLVNNALDASTDEQPVDIHMRMLNDDFVVEIYDCGEGMSEEVLERVSEPFFTTKPQGKGMGLGVFLARTLVENIGGKLNIQSSSGHGTTVRVHLPQHQEPTHERVNKQR